MQACSYTAMCPTSFDGGGRPKFSVQWSHRRPITASAPLNHTHYDVLGLLPNASSSEIKKAYRLLALKYHPDVNKDIRANEDFKSVRLAYEVLINESTRREYDRALRYQPSCRRPLGDEWFASQEYEDGPRLYRWRKKCSGTSIGRNMRLRKRRTMKMRRESPCLKLLDQHSYVCF